MPKVRLNQPIRAVRWTGKRSRYTKDLEFLVAMLNMQPKAIMLLSKWDVKVYYKETTASQRYWMGFSEKAEGTFYRPVPVYTIEFVNSSTGKTMEECDYPCIMSLYTMAQNMWERVYSFIQWCG